MTNDDDLHALLAMHDSAGAPHFASGFADRVLARIAASPEQTISLAFERYARRVLPLMAAASLLLGVWNWWTVRDRAPSTFSAVLGVATVAGSALQASRSLALSNTEAFE